MKKSVELMLAAAAAASFSLQAFAADAPAPAEAKAAAVKTAAPEAKMPAPTFEGLLSFLPDVLAEVNGEKITKKDFIAQLNDAHVHPAMLAQYPQELLKKLIGAQVDEMISQKILLALAKKNGFVPSADLVSKEMDSMYAKLTPQQKEQFEGSLKAQKKTFQSYKEEVAKNVNAQAAAALTGFITKNFVEKLNKTVTDADVEKFYREHQVYFEKPSITVSHILALCTGVDKATGKDLDEAGKAKEDAAAKAKIEAIHAKLKQGEKFEDLAEKESDCPSGKSSKGKLPAFTTSGKSDDGGMMEQTFTKAAFALEKPGQISEIIKTPFGYHIIRLEEKKAPQFVPLADVKDEIKAQLVNEKISEAIMKTINENKKEMKAVNFLQIAEKLPSAAPAAPAAKPAAPAAPAAK